ncbi:DUF3892 domain-containing protein [Sorangium sp. So ce176]|uniref:DUF3892 domain-containing protein n=1 Tax=Sorangium sp. So ce176 TaxID=3133286 RepID=UPI003F5E0353
MAERQVTRTGKNTNGDITRLCNHGEHWSPRTKSEAIRDIDSGVHTYFVSWPDGRRTEVRVVSGPTGRYLRTDRDSTTRNNLADLPDC